MDPAMVDTAGHPPPPSTINVLAELHYKGATMDVGNDLSWKYLMEQILPQIEKDGLKLYGAYSWVHIGRDHFEIDPGISANIAALQTSGAAIWLPITSKEFKPSDAAGDDLVAAAIRQLSDEAQKYGLPGVL